METLLSAHDAVCVLIVRLALRGALAVDDWRRSVRKGARRLRGSVRRLLRGWLRRHGHVVRVERRRGWNRTAREVEEEIVRLHVEVPALGAGQLRHLARRVLGFDAARSTFRRIVIRNQGRIAELEGERGRPGRRIAVRAARVLWGVDLTLIWVLGFLPVWVLGAVDYHGSRIVALEPVAWPSAAAIGRAMDRAFARHGCPRRILTDRGSVFRSRAFAALMGARGIVHTMTRPYHPWTNGRIERVFRTFKETLRRCYWMLGSRAQVARACRDFEWFYNTHRPHGAFGGRTPDEVHAGRAAGRSHGGRLLLFDGRLRWWRFS